MQTAATSEESEDPTPVSANILSEDIHIALQSPFIESSEEITAGRQSDQMYSSVLSAPPSRRVAQAAPNSPKTPSAVDPWTSGPDPWKQSISVEFADRYRDSVSPAASTVSFADQYRASAPTSAVALTRSLFESPVGDSSPVVPSSDFVRPVRSSSTGLSVSEAKKARFLPP